MRTASRSFDSRMARSGSEKRNPIYSKPDMFPRHLTALVNLALLAGCNGEDPKVLAERSPLPMWAHV